MATNMHDHWSKMKDKAAMHMAAVTEKHEPQTEADVKWQVEYALKHGTCHDAAEVIGEAIEWMVAHMMCEAANAALS